MRFASLVFPFRQFLQPLTRYERGFSFSFRLPVSDTERGQPDPCDMKRNKGMRIELR